MHGIFFKLFGRSGKSGRARSFGFTRHYICCFTVSAAALQMFVCWFLYERWLILGTNGQNLFFRKRRVGLAEMSWVDKRDRREEPILTLRLITWRLLVFSGTAGAWLGFGTCCNVWSSGLLGRVGRPLVFLIFPAFRHISTKLMLTYCVESRVILNNLNKSTLLFKLRFSYISFHT